MEDNNYIVIQGWMVNKLNLTGNNLFVYAIIYGFSQDGDSKFQGTRKYLAESIGKTLKTIDNVLSDLTEQGLIIKHKKDINGVILYDYAINHDKLNFTRGEKNSLGAKKTEEKSSIGGEKSLLGSEKITLGSKKISPHNNIENNIDNNIDNNSKEINKEKKRFVKPTLDEVKEYCREKGYTWNPETFYNYHEMKGWIVNRSPMKDWKAAIRYWNSNQKNWNKSNDKIDNGSEQRKTDEHQKYPSIL